MINAESVPIADDRPEADVLDQLRPVVDSVDDVGLDLRHEDPGLGG